MSIACCAVWRCTACASGAECPGRVGAQPRSRENPGIGYRLPWRPYMDAYQARATPQGASQSVEAVSERCGTACARSLPLMHQWESPAVPPPPSHRPNAGARVAGCSRVDTETVMNRTVLSPRPANETVPCAKHFRPRPLSQSIQRNPCRLSRSRGGVLTVSERMRNGTGEGLFAYREHAVTGHPDRQESRGHAQTGLNLASKPAPRPWQP
ncbi:hypothetical protein P3T16_004175 [Paraburkholderia sp. GAS42]